jgi:hypothetical protein
MEKSQEVAKIDFASERIHDHSLSCLGIFTSIKKGADLSELYVATL